MCTDLTPLSKALREARKARMVAVWKYRTATQPVSESIRRAHYEAWCRERAARIALDDARGIVPDEIEWNDDGTSWCASEANDGAVPKTNEVKQDEQDLKELGTINLMLGPVPNSEIVVKEAPGWSPPCVRIVLGNENGLANAVALRKLRDVLTAAIDYLERK